jgi:hypothetical protein
MKYGSQVEDPFGRDLAGAEPNPGRCDDPPRGEGIP